MRYIRKIRHQIAHLFGLNYGHVESWYKEETLMIGFRCTGCGKLLDAHPAPSDSYTNKPTEDNGQQSR